MKKKIILLTFLLVGLFIFAKNSQAVTYYASPAGNGTICSDVSPCSLVTGTGKLVAGDTLYLKDGIYSQNVRPTKSGTASAYITIKAVNDGMVTVSDYWGLPACHFKEVSYINVQGFICKGQGEDYYSSVNVDNSHYLNFKRMSAHSKPGEDGAAFVSHNRSSHILFEDCMVYGNARVQYDALECTYVTFRRCWGIWHNTSSTNPVWGGITQYGSQYGIVENNIISQDNATNNSVQAIIIWSHYYSSPSSFHKYYGNIAYNVKGWGFTVNSTLHNLEDNKYQDNVSINNANGFMQRADDNMTINKQTVVGSISSTSGHGYQMHVDMTPDWGPKDADWGLAGNVKNSNFINNIGYGLFRQDGALTHSYNNMYNNARGNYGYNTTQGTGEISVNPNYNTAIYGKGAYLMVPAALKGKGENGSNIGAEVLYRYQDGVLTNTPLWPWPMEDRIKRETGYSVTYESGGGLWKTLNGVYATTDTTPPAAPSGLSVQ